MTYRILHLSDLHLDRAFASMGCQGELARRRRQGLRDALRRAGHIAKERECNAITIGGDLYEHDRAGVDTARFLVETFASWQPCRVIIAPGNHDAFMPGSLYSRTEWPRNVHIFTNQTLTPLALDEGLTLWGLGHREPAWQGDPLENVNVGADDGIHLALFHGADISSRPDGKAMHGPFSAERIKECGFAVALSGHYHRRRIDIPLGLIYPGSPEPLAFDEHEPRGPVIIDIDSAGNVQAEGLEINAWTSHNVDCELVEVSSFDNAVEQITSRLRETATPHDPDYTLARVNLYGEVPSESSLDLITLETHIKENTGLAALRIRDFTTPAHDIELIAQEQTTRGAFVRTMQEALQNAGGDHTESAALIDALHYGLQALSGVEVGLR